jgi:hypothetical protein
MLAIIDAPSPQIQHADLTSKVRLDATIEAKIQTATAEKKANFEPASKVQRIDNIRENRARERESAPPRPEMPTTKPSSALVQPSPPSRSAAEYAGERSAEVIDLLGHLRPGARN